MLYNLNEKLNAASLQITYQGREFIQVEDILPSSQATGLHSCLAKDTPWHLLYLKDGKEEKILQKDFDQLPMDQKQVTFQHVLHTAQNDYQFMYYNFPVTNNHQEKNDPDFPLLQWLDFMNSGPVLDFIRTVSGIPDIVRADAIATKFIGNCFLHRTRDLQETNTRRVAYVMNLTEKWNANWGGYLQMFDENMNIEHSFKPAFNALILFKVPRDTSIGSVPPFCPGERLSLTGWFHAVKEG